MGFERFGTTFGKWIGRRRDRSGMHHAAIERLGIWQVRICSLGIVNIWDDHVKMDINLQVE